MNTQDLQVAGYRFRATFRKRRGGYLTLLLLVGLVGGLAMGSVANARRTQASFSNYLVSTNPSNLNVTIFGGVGNGGGSAYYSPAATRRVERLPGVKHVGVSIPLAGVPLRPNGSAIVDSTTLQSVFPIGTTDGQFVTQDRLVVTQGKLANPDRPNQLVMTAEAADLLGFHVGQVIPYGFFTQAQESLPGLGTTRVKPYLRLNATLVGLVQINSAIVQDDIDRLPTFVFFTPAFTKEILAAHTNVTDSVVSYGLQLVRGDRGVSAVEREITHLIPAGTTFAFHAAAPVAAKVDLTVKPLAIALAVLGGIAALATLLIGAQIISRQLRGADEELGALRALGASTRTIALDGLMGILGAVVVGSILAATVAVALSPLSPLGPVRPVYPGPTVAFDWTVLGVGILVLIVGLGGIAIALTYRGAPHRIAGRSRFAAPGGSKVAGVISSSPLPAPAAVGVRFALEPGRGRNAVPVRSALLGSVLALTLVVATLTFGSSLQSLISQPALYGWNWSYLLNATNNVPPQTLNALDHDRDVSAWTGYDYNVAEINGQYVPFLFQYDHPQISPPILSGHTIEAKSQIVLGAQTLQLLHKRVGDTVMVSYGVPGDGPVYVPPTRLVIVGTATMPAIGFSSFIDDHTSMGTGAMMSEAALPASFRRATSSSDPTLNGPNLVMVRLRNGLPKTDALSNLRGVAAVANRALAAVPNNGGSGQAVSVLGAQRPAQIVNYGTIGATPGILAGTLAGGAVIALGMTLITSVRRRRRDLALLKTLGFTQRQLAAAVAWQATAAVVIGIVLGVPFGIALGRWLWDLFAGQIYTVPTAAVPALSIVLVSFGALLVANLVAAVPGRSAARTSTALLLRSE